MASLSDTLAAGKKKLVRGSDGSLSEETVEEVQGLSGKAGLVSPPLSPIGTAAIGGNEHQQKMAGSPAQKEAALDLAQQPPNANLTDALRKRQLRTTASTDEAAQKQKSADIQALGSLGDRVSQLIGQQKAALVGAAPVQAQVSDKYGSDSILRQNIEKFRNDPTSMDAARELNLSMGRNADSVVDPTEIENLYESTGQSLTRGASNALLDTATVADLSLPMPTSRISELLRVPESEVARYTVPELQARIAQIGQEEQSTTQQLEQQAVSANAGAAEQGLARQAAAEASTTGVRASEAQYKQLEDRIAKADTVIFNGKPMALQDMLSDENISGAVQAYLEAPEGSETRAQLEKNEPALVDFVKKNKQLLDTAVSRMQQGAGQFQEIQKYNKSLGQMEGVDLDPSITAAIPGFGKLSTSKIDISQYPLLAAGHALPPGEKRAYAEELNSESKRDPETAKELGQLSTQEIQALGIGKGADSKWATQYIAPKRQYESLQAAGNDPDKLASIATTAKSKQEAEKLLHDNKVQELFGFSDGIGHNVLDANGDGVIDDPQSIALTLRSQIRRPSLRGAVEGSNPVYKPIDIPPPKDMSTEDKELLAELSPSVRGGQIEGDRLFYLASKMPLDKIQKLSDMRHQIRAPRQDFLGNGESMHPVDAAYAVARTGVSNKVTGAASKYAGGSMTEEEGRENVMASKIAAENPKYWNSLNDEQKKDVTRRAIAAGNSRSYW